MSRTLWGEFTEDEKPGEIEKMIPVGIKKGRLDEMPIKVPEPLQKEVTVKMNCPLVTQTIEVMKQTEMLQSLIDTYANKSGSSNYLLNPSQMIPEVHFPPENSADLSNVDKFCKPIWFVPPLNTPFSRAVPKRYPEINAEVCQSVLRKAVCGHLCIAGFTDASESSLVLFADAAQEFVYNLLQQTREIHEQDSKRELKPEMDIQSLEKAYYSMTNNSLMQIHNYMKHNLIARNRSEITEFKAALQEYDKLMKESQQGVQKDEFQEGDFLNMLEMPQSNEGLLGNNTPLNNGSSVQTMGVGNSMVNLFDGQTQHIPMQQ